LSVADKIGVVTRFLQEGLLAIIPVYETGEMGTLIYTQKNRQLDPRSSSWFLNSLAEFYCIELTLLRQYYSRYLGVRRNVTLPLAPEVILLPIKARKAGTLGESTVGYINLLQLKEVMPLSSSAETLSSTVEADSAQVADFFNTEQSLGAAPRSLVLFKNGSVIYTLNTLETLQKRICQGRLARREFLSRHANSGLYPGLTHDDFINILPPCDCILKDLFIRILNKGE